MRISLCSQFAAHVLSICAGSDLVFVEPADVSLEDERLGCASSARCPLFSFLFFFRGRGVLPRRSRRETWRNACAAKLRTPWPSDPAGQVGRSAGGTRGGDAAHTSDRRILQLLSREGEHLPTLNDRVLWRPFSTMASVASASTSTRSWTQIGRNRIWPIELWPKLKFSVV